ncbi:MAG: ABC transporter substrate-binding protein [Anaerolineales bacterium]
MSRSVLRLAALLLLPALVAGCVPRLPPVVKIGLIAPFEGRYRYLGYDAVYAARLAVREINAAGGAGGQRLELVAYDDRGAPQLARVAARNLAVDPAVVAVIGDYRQESTAAAAEVLADAGIPLVAIGAWLPRQEGVWHLAPTPERVAGALVQAVPGGGAGAVWGEGPVAEALREEALAVEGGEASIFSLATPVETGEQLARRRAEGWAGRLVGGPELASSTFVEISAAAGEGARFVTPYPFPGDLPAMEGWIAAYRDVGPHVPEPGPYALPTYEAVYLLAGAVTVAAEEGVTRSTVAQGLSVVEREGALGRVAWGAGVFWVEAPLYLYEWRAGEARLVGEAGAP